VPREAGGAAGCQHEGDGEVDQAAARLSRRRRGSPKRCARYVRPASPARQRARPVPGPSWIGHTSSAHVRATDMTAIEVRHPLVQHKLGLLRDASLSTKSFRELVTELGTLLAYEATADLETETATTTGWAGPVQVRR